MHQSEAEEEGPPGQSSCARGRGGQGTSNHHGRTSEDGHHVVEDKAILGPS